MATATKSQRDVAASSQTNNNQQDVVTSIGHPIRDSVLALTLVLSKQIGRAFDSEIEERFGLHHSEWRVMLTIAASPDATAVDIIDSWAMDKMAVSRAIARLESRGYIRRRQSHADRRRYGLSFSPVGQKAYDRILPHAMSRHQELLACLTDAETTRLRQLLQKLSTHAQSLGPRQSPS